MFRDAQYVKWANEETVHLLSYSLDPNAETPEPVFEAKRDGETIEVLVAYPMFTVAEADLLVNVVNKQVKFPLKAPWVGVLALDGSTVLASGTRGTSKEYRELYDVERKKVGAAVPYEAWKKVNDLLERSAAAGGDEKWRDAVRAALDARAIVKSPTPALAERIGARVRSLDDDGRKLLEQAQAVRDAADREKAVATLRGDFAGMPFLEPTTPSK